MGISRLTCDLFASLFGSDDMSDYLEEYALMVGHTILFDGLFLSTGIAKVNDQRTEFLLNGNAQEYLALPIHLQWLMHRPDHFGVSVHFLANINPNRTEYKASVSLDF